MKQHKATVFYKLPGQNPIVKKSASVMDELVEVDFNADNTFYFSPYNKGSKAYQFNLEKDIKLFEVMAFSQYHQAHYDNQSDFIHKVQVAVDTMKNNNSMSKVVLARCSKINIDDSFNVNAYFLNLCTTYPNAFVYAVSSSVTGTWIAATPELLMGIDNQTVKTTALAGTRLSSNDQLSWGEKEITEHYKVEYYIEQLLAKYPFKQVSKQGPVTINAGHLEHIFSAYLFQNDPQYISQFLSDLNPTPAVGGLPKETALSFINEQENLARKFYTGFAGVSNNNQLQLFVNLRCMELFKKFAVLYAGGGITADSNAAQEWIETENKLAILAKFIA
ncbi:MAG: chorismate-binding protein [Bacteroidota bacterium]